MSCTVWRLAEVAVGSNPAQYGDGARWWGLDGPR